jgi:hypothetical protein
MKHIFTSRIVLRRSMPVSKILILLSVALLFSACAMGLKHVYNIKGYDADPANLKYSKNKKVAVVFLEPDIKRQYISSAQAHTFIFDDVKAFYEQTFSTSLRGYVSSVKFFTAEPGRGYHLYLYPKLKLNITSSLLGFICKAEYELVAKNRRGREISRSSNSYEYKFGIVANAPNAAKICLVKTFAAASYNVFGKMDRR